MDILLNNAAARGMTLDSDNSGDGNCMFFAIAQQLRKLGIKKSHTEVRREIVNYLSKHPLLGTSEDAVYLTGTAIYTL